MNRIASGGYIEVILTSDTDYACEEIIDNLLIEGINSAAVEFLNPIYLISILNGSAALPRVCCRWDRKEGFP